MGEHPVPEYHVMLTTDIEAYSSRTDAEQRDLQSALADALNTASDAAELNRDKWLVQVGGDSVFAILPTGTNLARVIDRFVREVDAWLGGYNRRRASEAWTRMRLRLAVHAAPVFVDGPTGWPGQHAVLPVRLRDCEPVRAALRALQGADLAVIVSGDVYRDYITQGPGNPRPTEFRAVLARGKDRAYLAHLIVPGFDVHALSALARYDASDMTPPEVAAPRSDGGEGSAPLCPADGRRASTQRGAAVNAGRDAVHGDVNKVRKGNIYRAGRDITLPAEQGGMPSDG